MRTANANTSQFLLCVYIFSISQIVSINICQVLMDLKVMLAIQIFGPLDTCLPIYVTSLFYCIGYICLLCSKLLVIIWRQDL
jgi:hypothetical protein